MASTEGLRRRGDKYWLYALVATGVLAVVASPWLVGRWGEWTTSLQDRAAVAPQARLGEQQSLGGSASLLIVVTDDVQATRAMALLTRPDEAAGVLTVIPVDLFEILPGYGEFAFSQATVFEGPGLLALALENGFGFRVDEVVSLDAVSLAEALPDGAVVSLSNPLIVAADDGSSAVVADVGAAQYDGDGVATLLMTRGTDDPLAWLERQAAAWEGILAAAADDPEVTVAIAALAPNPETATGVIASVAADEPRIALAPVKRSAGAGDADGFTIDSADAVEFVASRLPHLALADGERPRVEVLNGNGRVLATRPIVEALVREGFRVIRTGNAERFDIPETLVIAQGRERRGIADQALAAIGLGTLQLELSSPSGLVDVSIIVGLDVPAGEG